MSVLPAAANLAWFCVNQAAYWQFRRALHHPRQAQDKILRRYLAKNFDSAFGREHNFASIDSVAQFQSRVPIRNYDELASWIDRTAAGEQNVLTRDPVNRFTTSSGSTRARKLLPFTRSLQREFNRAIGPWIVDLFRSDPSLALGCAYWSITPAGDRPTRSTGGLPIGFDDDSAYLGGWAQKLVDAAMAVPASVARISDMPRFRDATMKYLLARRDLRLISVWHPSFLEALLDSNHDWRSAWPKLRLISCWADAHAGQPAKALASRFSGVRIQPKGLLATEAFVSIPFAGAHPLAVRSHFFEFLSDDGNIKLADELRVGDCYEVIVTTAAGLWRYRLGDRIQVDGMVGKTPSLRFIGRADHVVDHRGEKLSEGFVGEVIRKLLDECEIDSTFSMLAPQLEGDLHYTLFIQSKRDMPRDLAERLDQRLRANVHYDYCRKLSQIGPARIFVIQGANAFARYADELERAGMRLGDIKPTALSNRTNWSQVFANTSTADDNFSSGNSYKASERAAQTASGSNH